MIGSPNQVLLEIRKRYSMAFECFGVNGFYFGKLDPSVSAWRSFWSRAAKMASSLPASLSAG